MWTSVSNLDDILEAVWTNQGQDFDFHRNQMETKQEMEQLKKCCSSSGPTLTDFTGTTILWRPTLIWLTGSRSIPV